MIRTEYNDLQISETNILFTIEHRKCQILQETFYLVFIINEKLIHLEFNGSNMSQILEK